MEVFSPEAVPPDVLRARFLERQPQSLGSLQGYVDPGANVPVPVSNITNIMQGGGGVQVSDVIQRTLNNSQFFEYVFTDSLYLPAKPGRNYLLIQNQGVALMYVSFTGISGTFTQGMQIIVGGNYEPYVAPKNTVSISGSGYCVEGVVI